MPLWMQAADVIVTKAGPGTISEAVAVGLPILLYGFVPGQEAGNMRWVVDSGAGLFVSTSESLVAALRELADPSSTRLAEMRDRVRRLARPDAALRIAHLILSLMFP
jgi:1,2-diacylglycerol 3-beta-galactosyltransferase